MKPFPMIFFFFSYIPLSNPITTKTFLFQNSALLQLQKPGQTISSPPSAHLRHRPHARGLGDSISNAFGRRAEPTRKSWDNASSLEWKTKNNGVGPGAA